MSDGFLTPEWPGARFNFHGHGFSLNAKSAQEVFYEAFESCKNVCFHFYLQKRPVKEPFGCSPNRLKAVGTEIEVYSKAQAKRPLAPKAGSENETSM